MNYLLLTAPLTVLLTLSACGGSSSGGDSHRRSQTVTLTAPTSEIINRSFTVSWTSTNSASCSSNFAGGTDISGTAIVTETTVGTKTYSISCTGLDGTVSDTTTTLVSEQPTAEGLWSGTKGSAVLTGAVTKEGAYWLIYHGTGSNAGLPRGFIAGTGTSTSLNVTDGSLSSANLRDFNFEGGGAAQGTTSALYTTKSSFSGNLESVSVSSSLYNVTGTLNTATSNNAGVTLNLNTLPFGATLPLSVPVNTPISVANSQLDITGTTINSGTLNMPNYGLFASLAGQTLNFYLIADSLGSGYNFGPSVGSVGAGWDLIGPPPSNCVGPASSVCSSINAVKPEIDYALSSTGANTYHLILRNGDLSGSYTTYDFSLTTLPIVLPSIADTTFATTYDSAYEISPTLSATAGNYTGEAGVGNAMQSGIASLTLDPNGNLSAGSTGSNGCGFVGTLVAHPGGGNLYDASLTFTSGVACAYSGAFSGIATYKSATHQLSITAINVNRDKGFLFVGTKP